MVYQARTRKRVFGVKILRGPDGSAFQKCETCGISVAIALADMHQCESRKDAKKLKCQLRNRSIAEEQRLIDQPRSAFRIFMEDFVKKNLDGNEFEVDNKGFETWKNMTREENFLYFMKAETINLAHEKLLRREEKDMPWRVDDEADSADVGKYDENYEDYDYSDSESSGDLIDFWPEADKSFDTSEREDLFPLRARIKS
ncbi:high mobility group B protein 7 [Capsicum chacoense]